MPVNMDYTLEAGADCTLTIPLAPPTNIAGWTVQYFEAKRFGATSGLVVKSMASGYFGSGMSIVNSGQGIFQININAIDSSGRDPGAYAFQIRRLDSGCVTVLTKGYRLIPNPA